LQETILGLAELLRKKSISPVELTTACLARIEKLNPSINAFITVTAEAALTQARLAEAEIQRGDWRGPLHGIPIAIKDLLDTAGIRTTAASALFRDRIPTVDADVVRRLKDAGAVLLGKQNLHEFAYGGSSMVSYFGEVCNPWDPTCIAGGSSGGSAASVAAGLGYGAIGTDTAGSIREPAALCGVVGLKPTYGRISVAGAIPLSPSLDHVGPIAGTVGDVAALFQAICGPNAKGSNDDNAAMDFLSEPRAAMKTPRIGIPRALFFDDLDPEVESAIGEALTIISAMSAEIRDIELSVSTDRTLQSAESYACHAEFVARTPELYQPETLRRILTGQNINPLDIVERRRELAQIRREIAGVFENTDLLVTPTTPIPAPRISELKEHPELLRPRELLLLRNTRPVNVWGLPAISIPCGFTKAGLPIGLQLIGPNGQEAKILQVAHAYEQATQWHKRRPMISDM
jgi:aspartyl-tRNA(Asn)/glutamyl-tRNA(Gln) amidotransferase subunit A